VDRGAQFLLGLATHLRLATKSFFLMPRAVEQQRFLDEIAKAPQKKGKGV
jgi:hypothetical protein